MVYPKIYFVRIRRMNITFTLTSSYEQEFTSSNIVNNEIMIEQVSVCCDVDDRSIPNEVIGSCIVLDTINNMQERKQSPLIVINDVYQSDKVNIVVPKTSKWRFFVTDKDGNRIKLNRRVKMNLCCSVFDCRDK